MTPVTTGITDNVKTFPVICLTSLRDHWNGTVQTASDYTLLNCYYFFYLGFLSLTFTIHKDSRGRGRLSYTPVKALTAKLPALIMISEHF